jgi:hypothetical protein
VSDRTTRGTGLQLPVLGGNAPGHAAPYAFGRVDRPAYAAAYVPEGHWAASEMALVHQRCFGAWLANRVAAH